MNIPKKEPLVHVTFRVPSDIRLRVQEIAKMNGVKEGTVYRAIVDDFFSANRQQNVEDKSTNIGFGPGAA